MQITGKIERIMRSEKKPTVTVIIETAEATPNYYSCTYFIREGREFPEMKSGDLVYASLSIKGRKWADPESGEVSYFTSLNITEIITIKKS